MKKNKRHLYKRLPKYALGTMKPIDLGYLPGRGIGSAKFDTEQNMSLEPETQAIRKSALPNALGYITQLTPYVTEIIKSGNKAATTVGTTATSAIGPGGTSPLPSQPLPSTPASTVPQMTVPGFQSTGGSFLKGAANSMANATKSAMLSAIAGLGSPAAAVTGATDAAIQSSAAEAISHWGGIESLLQNQLAQQGAKSGASSTLGTAMGAVGTALGAYTMVNLIAGFGDHRSPSDMLANVGRQHITTDMGNSYTNYNGVNAGQELAYEKANARSKQLGFGMNSIGTGASLGGMLGSMGALGSIGGPLGTALGAGVGLLLGGLGSLFGWGDNSEEIERLTRLTNDNIAMYNRQQEAVAKSKDVAAEFSDRLGVAVAEGGKSPYGPMKFLQKYSPGKYNFNVNPDGTISYGPTGSKIQGQEVTGNPSGDAAIAPGNPKEGDVVNSSITPYDDNFVISNLNPYIKKARNIVKDQNRLNDIIANAGGSKEQQLLQIKEAEKMKKINTNKLMEIVKYNPAETNKNAYKNGKLPGFEPGKRSYMMPGISDYLMNLVPHLYEFGMAKYMLDRYKNASTYVPNTYVQNNGSANVINKMMSIRWDPTYALNDAKKAYNQANWQANRMAGLGSGGLALLRNANLQSYFDNVKNIRSKELEFNNNYRLAGLNKAIEYYDKQQLLLTDEAVRRFGWQQLQNAVREYGIDLKGKDKVSAITGAGHDLYGVMLMARSMDMGNRQLDLYAQLVANDKAIADAEVNNINTNRDRYNKQYNTSAGDLIKTIKVILDLYNPAINPLNVLRMIR